VAALNPILEHAMILLAVGTTAMAIVEFVKAVTRWRMRFHRFAVDRWLRGAPLSPEHRSRAQRFVSFFAEEWQIWTGTTPLQDGVSKRELLALVAGGEEDSEAWYDQTPEELFAGLGRSAQLALDFPDRYPALYAFLTSRAPAEGEASDAARWPELAPRLQQPGTPLAADAADGEDPDRDAPAAVRTRLGNLVAARVETLQNWSEWRSARAKQFLSFGIAAALFYVNELDGGFSVKGLLLGIVAGTLAPFAKDVTARLTEAGIRR
jgi:hypothetical protein